jgi:WD40 repeat protein
MLSRALSATVAILLSGPAIAAPPVTAAAFAPDGKQVVVGSQDGVAVYSWPDLKPVSRVKVELAHVHDLVFSPDGKTLLAAGGSPAEEGAVEVLSWPDGKRVRRVAEWKDLVYRVTWSPDGSLWAVASADGTCRVSASDSGKQLVKYEGHSRAVLAVVFLPDGKTAVSAGVDQTLQVWDATTGKHVRTLDNHTNTVNDLAVRPHADKDKPPVLASIGEDRTVRLWQPTTGRLMRFTRLESVPRAVVWSPDGTRLLVGCNDGKVRVLDPDTLEVASTAKGLDDRVHTLIHDPKGKSRVLVGGAGIRGVEW